ncbi:MAG: tetratricopeptide repeat protein [Gammaproteobacteria bacterium]|nr:tetratricopeptide repeat protein [Gammaproteobacteria bacterium]
MPRATEGLERLLVSGRDDAVLRFSLGNAYLYEDPEKAVEHFERALEFDPGYSAAWKLLGKALASKGEISRAREVFSKGIVVAESRGDVQAAKEMRVFMKRLEPTHPTD